jgi:hypothetical protein
MRRAVGLLIVAMLFAVGSSTALATTTQKITINALIAGASWEDINEDTGAGEFGTVDFARTSGATTVTLSISKGELVLCEGGDTPDDEFDDLYGFVGTETNGEGPATMTVGRTYSSAIASGKVTAEVFTFDECTGEEGTSSKTTINVSLALDGVSPVITEKLHSTIRIPKQLRSKIVAQARSREAAGTLKLGNRSMDVGGVIGLLRMKASTTER